jgi:GTP-binding protein
MLDKHRVLAITKCDLLDEELIEMLREETLSQPLPTGRGVDTPTVGKQGLQGNDSPPSQGGVGGESLPVVIISAVANKGLDELKDVLWRELNAESNKLAAVLAEDSLVHRDKDMTRFAEELADEGEDEDIEYIDDVEDLDDLEDFDYEEDEQ